jgi:hypothetical protein
MWIMCLEISWTKIGVSVYLDGEMDGWDVK